MEAIAAVIMLHLFESQYKREINAQSLGLEFMIGGVLTLANEKNLIRRA